MKQKRLTLGIVSLITLVMVAVYLFGVPHGHISEGLVVVKEAVAAE